MELTLRGRPCLITGASRGIGREVAKLLAQEGARVAVCSRDGAMLDELVGEVESRGAEALALPADVTEPGASRQIVEAAAERFGDLEVLVTCAAGDAIGSVEADSSSLFSRIGGKARPAIESAQAAVPFMRQAGYGRIVLLGGLAVRTPFNHLGPEMGLADGDTTVAQGLGNSALSAFAKYLSDEVGPQGTTVNIVHPGIVATDRSMESLRRRAERNGEDVTDLIARIERDIPVGRLVQPRDVANLVVFLISPLAGAITGQSVAVDGGQGRSILY